MLLCLTFPLLLSAQAYEKTVVVGKQWDAECNAGMGQYFIWQFTLKCDTVINSKNYLVLYLDDLYVPPGGGGYDYDVIQAFVREDTIEQKVYRLEADSTEEVLIFDFMLEVGDTFYVEGYQSTVVDVSTQYFYGKNRKRIVLYPSRVFYEGLGFADAGLYAFTCGPGLLDFRHVDTLSCPGVTTNIGDISETERINIYPNPARDQINIALSSSANQSEKNGKIISLTGQVVRSFTIQDSRDISVETLPAGLYFIEIEDYQIEKLIIANR